jgi:hypothetical protein
MSEYRLGSPDRVIPFLYAMHDEKTNVKGQRQVTLDRGIPIENLDGSRILVGEPAQQIYLLVKNGVLHFVDDLEYVRQKGLRK